MRKYDEEFKREAVRKIHDGQSVASVARELGCAESLLHRWKRDAVEASSDSEKELIVLRKRLREVEMERDILKKAALIFGRRDAFPSSMRLPDQHFYGGMHEYSKSAVPPQML